MQCVGRWLNLILATVMLLSSLPRLDRPLLAAPATATPIPSVKAPDRLPSVVIAASTARELVTTFRTFLPLVSTVAQPIDTNTRELLPGVGGAVSSLGGQVIAAFNPTAIQQPIRATLSALPTPQVTTPGLGVGGPMIQLTLSRSADGAPLTLLPSLVTQTAATPATMPSSVVTPSISLSLSYSDADIWGLDERTLALYTRQTPTSSWQRVPSAVYPERRLLVAHIEQPGEYVPLGQLSVAAVLQAGPARIALDPDDDDGGVVWPGRGTFGEITFNVRLANEVSTRLVRDGCVAETPLVTRGTTRFVSNQLRVDAIQGYGADVAATVAFNTLRGFPWGVQGDGGPITYARGGVDRDLAQSLLNEVFAYTSRRSTRPILPHTNLPPEYREFDRLTAIHAHLETLFLDHNYDFPIIDTGFASVADGVYAGIRRHLESRGFSCLVDPGDGSGPRPPPYPARPSAEQLQRWRDLGYQNYQRYGGDPVSFSTGNHILTRFLARIPGRGGLDLDLILTYNAQDQRGDLLGFGWTFPYNVRLQRYADDSVAVVHADGRTFLYEWDGSAYIPPAGAYDRLERDDEAWTLTSRDGEQSWRFQDTITGLGVLTEWRDRRGNALSFTHDLSGEDAWQSGNPVPRPPLTTITDAMGRTVVVESDSEGRITAFVLPDGRRFDLAYDARGDLVSITDANTPERGVHRYVYDERHRITQQIDPEGIGFLTNVYDDRDRIVEQADASGTRSFFRYDPIARTTTFIDNLGHPYVYTYDALNRVNAETDPLSRTVRTEYDGGYNVTRTVDARDNATTYRYDGQGNLLERRDPLPAVDATCRSSAYVEDVTRWTYNADNRVTSLTDALGSHWSYEYDGEGNLTRVVSPIGETKATYDEWGQLTSFTDANDRLTTYDYDTHGNLIATTDPLLGMSRSTYDIAGRELTYTDANSHSVGFAYNGNDQITRITDPKGQNSSFAYDRNDLLRSSTDRAGTTREFRYDEHLKLIAERDHSAGAWETYDYDRLYRRIATTDRNGFTSTYQYDPAGQLRALVEPNGATTSYDYDADGNLTRVRDAAGGETAMAYDAPGRLATTTDGAGSSVAYCYDAEDRLVATVGPRVGEVYAYTYDTLGRLTSITDPQRNVRRFAHDAVGNRVAETDPLGNRTDYRYDDLDRLIAVEHSALPDSTRPTTRFGYDPVGNTTTITSPRGFITRMEYDENDNLNLVVDPLGGRTSSTYDAEDRPIAVSDPNGNTTRTIYDPIGNPLSVTNDLGETTRLSYDPAYNLVRLVDPLGKPTTYDYDELGRLLRATDPLGNATTYRRDLLGRVTGVLDAEGRLTGYGYDPVGRLLAVTDALQDATRYEYDEAGNLVGMTDANSRTTRFAYNLLNQLTGEINPLGDAWRYAYDPNGRLAQRVDALARASFYEYDSNDRLVGVQYGAPANEQAPLTFAYDLDGNETRMCDGLGCFAHSYDALGRQTATTDWLGRTVRRSYDGVGNLTQLLYPGGRPVRYEYDGANRLAGVTDPRGATSVYQRDAAGQVTAIRHPNATQASYRYDAAGRLTALEHRREGAATPQSAYAYTLDRVGNRTAVRETRAAFDGSAGTQTLERTYGYDVLDRLTRVATNKGSDTVYSFDAVGNRLERSGTALAPDAGVPALPVRPEPVTEQSRYNAANQLVQSGDTSLGYDANGNRRTATRSLPDGRIETTTYRYDREDRLVGVERRVGDTLEMRAVYAFDGYGRRARKTVSYPGNPARDQQITYLYDGLEIISATIEEGGTTRELAFYLVPSPLTGLRRPFAMEELGSGARYWLQADGLDSVIALTDEDGGLVAPLLYDEYGQHLAGDTALQLFSFTAQDYDPETGLLHFHARMYDPATGTWLSHDLYRGNIEMPTTVHRYVYVHANPVNNLDYYGYANVSDINIVKPRLKNIAKAFNVPPEALAIVLEIENPTGGGTGVCPLWMRHDICRNVKRVLTPSLNISGAGKYLCSGRSTASGDCSMGLGNVKINTAKEIFNHFVANYTFSNPDRCGYNAYSSMIDAMSFDNDFELTVKLFNSQYNTIYVAANLRFAMDKKGYKGRLTDSQIATIVQHHNNKDWDPASQWYYDSAINLLERWKEGEDLQFLDSPYNKKQPSPIPSSPVIPGTTPTPRMQGIESPLFMVNPGERGFSHFA